MPRDILPALLLATAVLGGTCLTCIYDRRASLGWRLADGVVLGLTGLGLVGLLLAFPLELTAATVFVAGVAVLAPCAVLFSARDRATLAAIAWPEWPTTQDRRIRAGAWLLVYVGTAWLMWRVAVRTMFETAAGVYTGVSHNIGDLPFHLTVMSRFLLGDNLPPEHPAFAGAGFTYPFLADLIAAMFVRAGLTARTVIAWSTLLLIAVFCAQLYRWTLALTANRTAARLAPLLALFSGGLGWSQFAAEAAASPGPFLTFIGHLPHDYTITADNQYRWGNLVTSLLVTQRGLLLAMPLALIVFRLWLRAVDEPDAVEGERPMIAAGVIAAALPLVHAHTFAVVLAVGGVLAMLSANRRAWMPFFAWSLALGLPQAWWLMSIGGVDGQRFLAWSVGWDRGAQNPILFWLKNTGLFIPLIAAAVLWSRRDQTMRRALLWCLPFTICFVAANLFRLAPWIWDNIKVLVYWFVGSLPLAALVLSRLAEKRRWGVVAASVIAVALTAAGGLDVWRVASGAFESRTFDRDGIAFAEAVARQTDRRALIVHAPVFNHPIGLSGRRSLMGYPGHVWSHGLDGGAREADIKRMYAGGPDAEALLARYHVDYLVIGPHERLALSVVADAFDRYPVAAEVGGYRLYRIGTHAN